MRGSVRAGTALRALAAMTCAALVGLAIQQDLLALALTAVGFVATFFLVDVGWLQSVAAEHVQGTQRRDFPAPVVGWWVLALYLLLLVIAVVAAVAIGSFDAGKAQKTPRPVVRNTLVVPNPSIAVVGALTPAQRRELRRLGKALQGADNSNDRDLGRLVDDLFKGVPAAATAIALWSRSSSGLAKKAAGIVAGALGRAGGVGATFRTTVRIGRPQLSLGGLHVNLSLGARSPPICKCKSRCSQCSGDGDGHPPAHPDKDGSPPPTTTTSTIPMTP